MKEVWKDIKGYEGLYQVSNLGRVKSLSRDGVKNQFRDIENIMIPNNTRYSRITLCNGIEKKQYSVHRLVAIAFISNPLNKKTVNHIDGNKNNNSLENLEWNTYSENLKHSFRILGRDPSKTQLGKKGILSHRSKRVVAYNLKGKLILAFECVRDVKKKGFDRNAVSSCARGKVKEYKNLIWKYI